MKSEESNLSETFSSIHEKVSERRSQLNATKASNPTMLQKMNLEKKKARMFIKHKQQKD